MPRLRDLAKLIRTKNAGPFLLTIDVMFETAESYHTVKNSGILGVDVMSKLYRLPQEDIKIYFVESANAIKITIPRPVISGDPGDADVFGGQQYGPLVDLVVP